MKTDKIKFGFSPREYDGNDFIIIPAPTISHAKDGKNTAISFGIKFGYWAIYIGWYRIYD